LAEVFYRAALAADLERLTELFEDAGRSGRLVISDARRAAEQFVGLCLADLPIKLALNVSRSPDLDQIRRQVREAVSMITSAYARAGAP
jgi:hypothetical protein